jgi:hypothetical protein
VLECLALRHCVFKAGGERVKEYLNVKKKKKKKEEKKEKELAPTVIRTYACWVKSLRQ